MPGKYVNGWIAGLISLEATGFLYYEVNVLMNYNKLAMLPNIKRARSRR
jgi:hypothetical protein